MSDSIRPVRYTPQVNRLNPKGRTGDKKGKQNFLNHMSDKDKDVKGRGHNKGEEEHQNPEDLKQVGGNSLQIENEHDLDETCGTILDSEV